MHAHRAVTGVPSLIGRVVDGRYRVLGELGSGAVGTVFRARDETTGQGVALKVWHGCDDEQTRGRFVREARALQTLQHPHIVDVYGMGFLEGAPYVAMELLDGQTLDDALSGEQPLDPERVRRILRQVLSAVAFAHERDVVHRDLKPENIFLVRGPDGQDVAKLLDYGLAKFLGGDDPLKGVNLTVTGMVMGTPLYMPPEQAAGSKVDVRVDVYALGCILFEMLTGRLPYVGDDFGQLIRAHVGAPIPKVTDVLPELSVVPELQTLLDTAMAKQPGDRYAHAGHMLVALEGIPRPWLRAKRAASSHVPGGFRASAVTDVSLGQPDDHRNTLLFATIASVVVVVAALVWALVR